MEMTPEERENICENYEEKTKDLIDEWLEDDNEDAQNLNADDIENDEVDGLKKGLKKMFGNCFGKDYISRATLNHPST